MGDDGIPAAFRACRCDGKDACHRQGGLGSLFIDEKIFPGIAIIQGAGGNAFCGIYDTAAANGQNKIHLLAFAEGYALLRQLIPWIGLYAAEADIGQARLLERSINPAENPRSLCAPAAIDDQYFLGRIRVQIRSDIVSSPLPKTNFVGE